jgi:hypothetical protein
MILQDDKGTIVNTDNLSVMERDKATGKIVVRTVSGERYTLQAQHEDLVKALEPKPITPAPSTPAAA